MQSGQGAKHDDNHRPHQQSTTFDSHDNPSTGHKPLPRTGALISHLINNAIDTCEEYTTQLDISEADLAALKEMSRDTFFLIWKDIHASEELEGSDEMQRRDPLAIQMRRFYSKTKKELPSQERIGNLTWCMMGMSLLKRRQEEAARYVQNQT